MTAMNSMNCQTKIQSIWISIKSQISQIGYLLCCTGRFVQRVDLHGIIKTADEKNNTRHEPK